MAAHLNNHHRRTLVEISAHPTSANVEWPDVRSLLEAVGSVTEEHSGKFKVAIGPETEVIHPPHGKDVEGGAPPVADERERDYGDSRRGRPTG